MNLDVYDSTNTTLIGTLSEAYGISFLDDLLIPGSARFSVDKASAADSAMLEPRRVVRFRTGASPGTGDIFGCIVQDRPARLASDIEPSSGQSLTTVTFESPGLLSWLGYRTGGAVLHPYRSLSGRQQNPRYFGWFSPDFDDSGWDAPVPDGPLSTADWPDSGDEINPGAVAFKTQNATRSLYRREMPVGELSGPARIYVVATKFTEVTVYLDSEEVLFKPAGAQGMFQVDVPYDSELAHLVAVEVTGGAQRWGLTWMLLNEVEGPNGTTLEPGGVLRRTFDPADYPSADSPWLEYHVGDYPGVTVGYVLDTALSEDDARHSRPWTWDFTAALDSDGQPWDTDFTRGFRVGPVGLLVDELSSIEGEPNMTPAGVFQMFSSRGTDRTATVTVSSPFDLGLSGRGPEATRWLFETDRGMGQIINAAAEAVYGVMETYVQLGTDIDPDAIGPSLVRQLERDAWPRDEVEVDLPDDVVPYVDVFLGDTVTCVGRDGTAEVRLMSFECQVQDAGDLVWTATAEPV